jgi:hypothetical protein
VRCSTAAVSPTPNQHRRPPVVGRETSPRVSCGLVSTLRREMSMTNEAELESRIRARGHKFWLDAGCPEGQAEGHWEQARLAIAEEDGKASALRDPSLVPAVEPVIAMENQGAFPNRRQKLKKSCWIA